jgi:hypothetical protein
MAFENLLDPRNEAPGIGEIAYVAPLSWFDTLQSPTGNVISGTHTFVDVLKGFIPVLLGPEKNSYGAKSFGEKGFSNLDHEAKLFLPGSYATLHEWISNFLNKPCIVLLPDANCGSGVFYQLGNSCARAYMGAEFATGTTKDGAKGYTNTVNWPNQKVILYTGEITIAKEQTELLQLSITPSNVDPTTIVLKVEDTAEEVYIQWAAGGAITAYTVPTGLSGLTLSNTYGTTDPAVISLWFKKGSNINSIACVDKGLTAAAGTVPDGLEVLDLSDNALTAFTAKIIQGSVTNIDLSGNALPVATVNDVLQKLLDTGIANGTANLDQTPDAVPTGAGAVAASDLVTAGWTVTVDV